MSITLTVNGENKSVDNGTTLASLVEELGLTIDSLVALVNEEVVERTQFADTALSEGDQVELVTFLPGG
jgi:thiamine biosynthesis protein ThiS